MNFPLNWYVEAQVARTITNLEKHTMQGCFVPDIPGMQARVREWLTPHSTVAVGDSSQFIKARIKVLLVGEALDY